MRTLLVLPLLLLCGPVMAACPRVTEALPAIPDGRTADEATLKAAHDTVQAYVNKLQAYQACLKAQEVATPDASVELKLGWLAQGDAAIDVAQMLASDYSTALKQFKERQPAAAK